MTASRPPRHRRSLRRPTFRGCCATASEKPSHNKLSFDTFGNRQGGKTRLCARNAKPHAVALIRDRDELFAARTRECTRRYIPPPLARACCIAPLAPRSKWPDLAGPRSWRYASGLAASRSTTLYSSNSGVWPGSSHPPGLFILAMLTCAVCEFTSPTNSSMILGLLPAALMIVGLAMYC